MRLQQAHSRYTFAIHIYFMKKLLIKVFVVAAMGSWTFMALASAGPDGDKCQHEWEAAFSRAEVASEDGHFHEGNGSKESASAESMIPGSLQSFLLH